MKESMIERGMVFMDCDGDFYLVHKSCIIAGSTKFLLERLAITEYLVFKKTDTMIFESEFAMTHFYSYVGVWRIDNE